LEPQVSVNPYFSIVSPVYRAEDILEELVKQLTEASEKVTPNYEIILVEDYSPDRSWAKISELGRKYPKLKGIKLSRNFGQHNAIAAGLYHTTGDYVIVMDCDLQDNPIYIPDLINKAKEGFDVVYTLKNQRKHNFFKDVTGAIFHRLFNYLVGNDLVKTDGKIGTYSLLSKKVVTAYRDLHDEYRPFLVMLNILGFEYTFLKIEHSKRHSGKSSYNLRRLINHAINGIISQTDRLLKLSIYMGAVYTFISFIYGIYVLYKQVTVGLQSGWPSLVLLITFSTGIILLFLGIIGLYISRIFTQVKNRPLFIVDRTVNF
jgi:dolichol-phosphate mannosyltransferase